MEQKNNKQPQQIKVNINQEDLQKLKLAHEDVDFIADSKAAMLVKSTPWAKGLLYFVLSFICVGLVWTSLARLDEVTRGMGTVIPASKVQVIQSLEGGILAHIYVKEGEEVEQGQILAQLDKTQFTAHFREARAKYITILASIARLQAEVTGKTSIDFPTEIQENSELMQRETTLFHSRTTYIQNTLKNSRHNLQLATRELNITEPLVKRGVMSKIELLRIKREVNNIKARIDAHTDDYREKALTALTQQQTQALTLTQAMISLEDSMNRTTIKSPVTGIVKQIYINTIGGVIKTAMPIMELVPLNDKLIVETRINSSDIAFIKIGQKATIRVTAYDYSIYGSLPGEVVHISADTSVDKNGNSYYQVDLKTEKNYLGDKPESFPLKPGMMAMVDIITGKKSMLSYLLKPILRAKEKAMRER